MDPFDPNLADAFHLYDIFDAAVGSLTDQYLTGCGLGFQPGRNVYLIADDGIVLMHIRSDISHGHVTGIDPDADSQIMTKLGPLFLEFDNLSLHIHRHPHRTLGMVLKRDGITKENEQPVPNYFIESAFILVNKSCHLADVTIQEMKKLFGFKAVGKCRKVTNI